jgi:hypothetical protein
MVKKLLRTILDVEPTQISSLAWKTLTHIIIEKEILAHEYNSRHGMKP